jgi:hypothetical protein
MACFPPNKWVDDGPKRPVYYKNKDKDLVCMKLICNEICTAGDVDVGGEVTDGGTPVATNNHNYVVVGAVPAGLPNARMTTVTSGHLTQTDGGAGSTINYSLPNTGVTAASYTLMSGTVDAQGRLTAASSGSVTSAGQLNQLIKYGLGARGFVARKVTPHQEITTGDNDELVIDWVPDQTSDGGSFILEHNYGGEFNITTNTYTVPEKGFYDIGFSWCVNLGAGVTALTVKAKIQNPAAGPLWTLEHKHNTQTDLLGTQTISGQWSSMGLNAGSTIQFFANTDGGTSHIRFTNEAEDNDNVTWIWVVPRMSI